MSHDIRLAQLILELCVVTMQPTLLIALHSVSRMHVVTNEEGQRKHEYSLYGNPVGVHDSFPVLVAWDVSRAMAKLQLHSTFLVCGSSSLTSLGSRLIVNSLHGFGRAAPLVHKAV